MFSIAIQGFHAVETTPVGGISTIDIFETDEIIDWSRHLIALSENMGEEFAREHVKGQIENALSDFIAAKAAAGITLTVNVPTLQEAKKLIIFVNEQITDQPTGW